MEGRKGGMMYKSKERKKGRKEGRWQASTERKKGGNEQNGRNGRKSRATGKNGTEIGRKGGTRKKEI